MDLGLKPFHSLAGLWVVFQDMHLSPDWEFPRDRFIQYEPKDWGWCRFFGFGREVYPFKVIRFGDTIIVDNRHKEQFLKAVKEAQR